MGPMNTEPTMMTIGSFAEVTLLSQKALRLYDERGLLRPARVDPANGYRLYSQDQAATGRLISLLRAAGMPLDTVAGVIECSSSGEALARIDAFADALHSATIASATVLDRARRYLTEEPMQDITTAPATDEPVLSELAYPVVDKLDTTIREALERLEALAAERGLTVTGDPFGIFHAPVNEESSGPLEVCLPVDGLTGPAGSARSYRLGSASTARVTVAGAETDFPAILAAYDTACEWVERSGHRTAGPPRETWHVLPWADEETVMTVSWPFAPAAG
ncbi:MAG: hypothetical protein JWR04_499 [Rhodoglobus sp.]|nr:hypothetical protein [Rhodoglobus sp.]